MKKQSRLFQKTTSLVLALVMFFPLQIIPTQALINNTKSTEAQPSNNKITAEATHLRSKYTKYFYLDNGNLMAVQYDYPVHYKEDKNWIEYDNQISKVESEDINDENSISDASKSLSTTPHTGQPNTEPSTANTSNISDFTDSLANIDNSSPNTSLPSETTVCETDTVDPSSNNIEEKSTEPTTFLSTLPAKQNNTEYKNKKSDLDIRLSQNAKKQNMIKINQGKYHVSWGFSGTNKSKIKLKNDSKQLTGNDKFLIPKNVETEAIYPNVFKGIDLQYTISSQGIKENIILKNADVQTTFEIEYIAKDLTPIVKDNHTIDLQNKEGKIIYSIFAPYMVDSANKVSTQLKLEIIEQKKNTFTLLLTADEQWVSDSSRLFPIEIDPSFKVDPYYYNLQAASLSADTPNTPCLETSSPEINQTKMILVKANTLPSLPSGSVIKKMTYNIKHISGPAGQLALKGYTNKTVDFSSTTWNNRPTGVIIDYNNTNTDNYTSFDITRLAYQWYYENKNYGFSIERCGKEMGTDSFYYYNFFPSSNNPYISIEFSYTAGTNGESLITQNIGRAGTATVSGYTGKLNVITDDFSFDENTMPLAISRIFDTSYTTNFGFGTGWRTNYNQQIFLETIDSKKHYYFIDEHGTYHTFIDQDESKTIIEDENGCCELTMDSNRNIANFVIKESNTVKTFNSTGFLTSIKNIAQPAQPTIKITYFINGMISTITDGAGRKYNFTYGYNGKIYYIQSIQYLGTGTTILRTATYGYDINNKLYSVKSPDDEIFYYFYTNNSISKIQNINYYNVRYTYKNDRVTKVSEHTNTTAGDFVNISYAVGMTTLTDAQNRRSVINYDPYGNQISTVDDAGRISYSVYGQNDSLLNSSSSLEPSVNYFLNPSFEESDGQSNFTVSTNIGNAKVNYHDNTDKYTGKYALSFSSDTAAKYEILQNHAYNYKANALPYTLSAWVNTSGSTAKASVKLVNVTTGDTVSSTPIDTNGEWTQISASIPSGATQNLKCYLIYEGIGKAYFDDVQLNPSSTPMEMTYITDGDVPYFSKRWTYLNGNNDLLFSKLNQTAYAKQRVYLNGDAGDSFTLSGIGSAPAVPTEGKEDWEKRPFFGLRVYEQNQSKALSELEFTGTHHSSSDNDLSDICDYKTTDFTLESSCAYVDIYFCYDYNPDMAFIGNVTLSKNMDYNYNFGENGVQGNPGQLTPPGNANVNEPEEPEETEDNSIYDSYDRLLSTTDENGMTSSYTYDDYGNTLTSTICDGYVSLDAENQYTTDGNYQISNKDSFGNGAESIYNLNYGIISQYKTPKNESTNYNYDALNRLTGVNVSHGASGNNTITKYTYSKDMLSSITHNTFQYNFLYNLWGDIRLVKIGNQNLVSFDYTDNISRLLSKTTYGNGQTINYVYESNANNQKLLTGVNFGASNRFSYTYTPSGELSEVIDQNSRRKTVYQPNGIIKIVDLSSNKVSYSTVKTMEDDESVTYETAFGNETKFIDVTDKSGQKSTRSYEYATGKTASAQTTTDLFGRNASSLVSTNSCNSVVNTEYEYKSPGSGKTSYTVEKEKISLGTSTPSIYTYSYDANGNITQAKKGRFVTYNYTYDNLGQLIQEDNASTSRTKVYAYDNGGNITSIKEYYYLSSSLLSSTDYVYGDDNWKDKLTSVGNKDITYDGAGNPLTYDGWSYSWEAGRQLQRMSSLGTTIDYTYDQDGMRTGKRVNGTLTSYIYNNGILVAQKTGTSTPLYFRYHSNGKPVSVNYNGTEYFYATNIFGDILEITDSEGNVQVSYTYDPWGNILYTSGSMATTLGKVNPLRYRGYVYDEETKLYYLQSRYYNPNWRRFINADTYTDTQTGALGTNMFAYCNNNPIYFIDPDGHRLILRGSSAQKKLALKALNDLADGKVYTIGDDCYMNSSKPKNNRKQGHGLVSWVINHKKVCEVYPTTSGNAVSSWSTPISSIYSPSIKVTSKLYYNPNSYPSIQTVNPKNNRSSKKTRPNFIGMGHELVHVYRFFSNKYRLGNARASYLNQNGTRIYYQAPKEELATVGLGYQDSWDYTENKLRKEHGLWLRGAY